MDKQEKDKHGVSLNRRDLLKVITAAPAAALVPLAPRVAEAAKAFPLAGESPSVPYKPQVLNLHEYKTIRVLSDLIIPADERSGSATEARVPEFIDGWLTFNDDMLRTQVLGGLAWFDLESNRHYGHDFVDSTAAEQRQLLDRVAFPGQAAPEDANATAAFNHIRDLVLAGFFTSEIGVKDLPYLGNQIVEDWTGCPAADLQQLGVSYSEDWRHWNSRGERQETSAKKSISRQPSAFSKQDNNAAS
jgi:gluconate 2-dehydrogenase gamma chain